MATSRAELLELFRKNATEVLEREVPSITDGTVISELNIDSLGMLEIVGSMERDLNIQLPDESLVGIKTISDLMVVVEKRQKMAAQGLG